MLSDGPNLDRQTNLWLEPPPVDTFSGRSSSAGAAMEQLQWIGFWKFHSIACRFRGNEYSCSFRMSSTLTAAENRKL